MDQIDKKYANVSNRVKAVVIDGIVLFALMFIVTEIFVYFENVPNAFRIIAFISIFFLYDPILISRYGATIGHSYSKIAVKKEDDPVKNLPFHKAIIRFMLKAALGWISLLTVTGSRKRQAIHDSLVNSIVIEQE